MSISTFQPLVLLLKNIHVSFHTNTYCGIDWINLTTTRENDPPGWLRTARVLLYVRLSRQGKYYSYCQYVKHINSHSAWWAHGFPTTRMTLTDSKNKCNNYFTRRPIFVQTSHLTRSPCTVHSALHGYMRDTLNLDHMWGPCWYSWAVGLRAGL